MYCIFDKAYHVSPASGQGVDDTFKINKPCRGEFILDSILAPLSLNDLRASPLSDIFCTDASPSGAGICTATVGTFVQRELWRRGDRKGRREFLLSRSASALHNMGIDPDCEEEPLLTPEPSHSSSQCGDPVYDLPVLASYVSKSRIAVRLLDHEEQPQHDRFWFTFDFLEI